MSSSPPPYLSYLLRLWLAGDTDQPQWHAALIDPQTSERRGFANLEALTVYLQARMQEMTFPEAGVQNTPHRLQEGEDEGEITD
jgi:hypothetical protein